MTAVTEEEEKKQTRPVKILIIFYTRYGNTAKMAEEIAYGAKEILGAIVRLKRIADDVPMKVVEKNPFWVRVQKYLKDKYDPEPIDDIVKDLPNYDAIIFGSPTRFGNMAAPMKAMWDLTSDLWKNGSLVGKVGAVFTGAASVHGGQETTAVSMMFPMLHHGMIIVGVPYSVPELTQSGSPYGPSRIVGPLADREIEQSEVLVARALGKRVAEITTKLIEPQR